MPGLPVVVRPESRQVDQLNPSLTFQSMQSTTLFQEQNEMKFYTWSDDQCCLPPGSTQASLAEHFPSLKTGEVLMFEEKVGPGTGSPDDADVSKRWAVRLTRVQQTDFLNRPLTDPLNGKPVTRIWWDAADALPFPLCISSTADAAHGLRAIPDVSVAHGNLVPTDHGLQQDWEDLGAVPPAPAGAVTSDNCSCGGGGPVDPPRARYFPRLAKTPLTFAAPFDASGAASAFLEPAGQPAPERL